MMSTFLSIMAVLLCQLHPLVMLLHHSHDDMGRRINIIHFRSEHVEQTGGTFDWCRANIFFATIIVYVNDTTLQTVMFTSTYQ
jgi:preprotein translocase subunit SecG